MSESLPPTVTMQYIGGPTALLDIAGLRIIIDPTFDRPGIYPIGARQLEKVAGPAVDISQIGKCAVMLLSHDQHPDNLDTSGRTMLETVPLIFSTQAAHERIGSAITVLPNWQSQDVPLPNGQQLRITGVPALHGPEGSEPTVGEVTGFVLSGEDLPTIYVSGDNASVRLVQEIADKFPSIDTALLFAGAARTALMDGEPLTLTKTDAVKAAQILGDAQIVPLHFEQWAHFTENGNDLQAAFHDADLVDRLTLLKPGQTIALTN